MLVKKINELLNMAGWMVLWHPHLISKLRQGKARLKFAFQLYCHIFKVVRQAEALGQASFGVLSDGKAEILEAYMWNDLEDFLRKAHKSGQTWKEQS